MSRNKVQKHEVFDNPVNFKDINFDIHMSKIRVAKQFSFEMAHALHNYDGACRNIHGHSYKLTVVVIGNPLDDKNNPKWGMVIDFKDLTKIIKEEIIEVFDHAVVLSDQTDLQLVDKMKKLYDNIIVKDYQPTCENLLINFVALVQSRLADPEMLKLAKLEETATSYAEWHADDQV